MLFGGVTVHPIAVSYPKCLFPTLRNCSGFFFVCVPEFYYIPSRIFFFLEKFGKSKFDFNFFKIFKDQIPTLIQFRKNKYEIKNIQHT